MAILILGLVLFLGVHSTRIVADGWRGAMVARLGLNPWKGIYSVLSLAGFLLIVRGYGPAAAASAGSSPCKEAACAWNSAAK